MTERTKTKGFPSVREPEDRVNAVHIMNLLVMPNKKKMEQWDTGSCLFHTTGGKREERGFTIGK